MGENLEEMSACMSQHETWLAQQNEFAGRDHENLSLSSLCASLTLAAFTTSARQADPRANQRGHKNLMGSNFGLPLRQPVPQAKLKKTASFVVDVAKSQFWNED